MPSRAAIVGTTSIVLTLEFRMRPCRCRGDLMNSGTLPTWAMFESLIVRNGAPG
jgi:hypothetical protein